MNITEMALPSPITTLEEENSVISISPSPNKHFFQQIEQSQREQQLYKHLQETENENIILMQKVKNI